MAKVKELEPISYEIAVIINTIFGLAAAWAITRFDFPGKAWLTTAIDLAKLLTAGHSAAGSSGTTTCTPLPPVSIG